MGDTKYPKEWLDRVPAIVFGSLYPGEIRIVLRPGSGLAQGGAPRDIAVDNVPPELRIPNTPLWVRLDDKLNVVMIWHRDE